MSLSQYVLEPKSSNYAVIDAPRADLAGVSGDSGRSLRPKPETLRPGRSLWPQGPDSPVGPRSPSLGDHIEQIECKNHNKVARKMIDRH
jgi:hypothetical protein